MAVYVEIDLADIQRLTDAITYVIENKTEGDPQLKEYLETELKTVQNHIKNERFGSREAAEIDVVMNFLGGKKG